MNELNPDNRGKHVQRLRALRPALRYILPVLGVGLLAGGLWVGPQLGVAMQAVTPTATILINPPPTVTTAPVSQSGASAAMPATAAQSAPATVVADEPATTAIPDERPALERTLNILVLGSDRRPNTPNWRTDVMMIVALDLDSGKAGVISIPRDVYIDSIPSTGGHK